jgi:hypothetical protein
MNTSELSTTCPDFPHPYNPGCNCNYCVCDDCPRFEYEADWADVQPDYDAHAKTCARCSGADYKVWVVNQGGQFDGIETSEDPGTMGQILTQAYALKESIAGLAHENFDHSDFDWIETFVDSLNLFMVELTDNTGHIHGGEK